MQVFMFSHCFRYANKKAVAKSNAKANKESKSKPGNRGHMSAPAPTHVKDTADSSWDDVPPPPSFAQITSMIDVHSMTTAPGL
jgi:hypothetical protein